MSVQCEICQKQNGDGGPPSFGGYGEKLESANGLETAGGSCSVRLGRVKDGFNDRPE